MAPGVAGQNHRDVELFHQAHKVGHDFLRRIGIERRRGLVGNDNGGPMGERTTDGYPLALTRGQGIWQLVQVVGNAEFLGQMLDCPVMFKAEHIAAEIHVLTYRQVGQQTAGLYHVTEMSLAQIAQLVEFARFPVGIHVQRFLVALAGRKQNAPTADGFRMNASMSSRVDLPQPDSPIRAIFSPMAICRLGTLRRKATPSASRVLTTSRR